MLQPAIVLRLVMFNVVTLLFDQSIDTRTRMLWTLAD